MRVMRSPLAAIVCLSLLGLQLGGVHMHAGTDGFDATPSVAHVHGAADSHDRGHDHGHAPGGTDGPARASEHGDHGGDRDVSIVDLAGALSKLLVFLVWFGLLWLVVLPPGRDRQRLEHVCAPEPRRNHWRPPLRAPPYPAC